MKRTHKVEFFYPGVIVAETDAQTVGHREPRRIRVPDGVFAFQFFDTVEWKGKREDGAPMKEVKTENRSFMFYPDGEVFTAEQLQASGKDYEVLLSNMKNNGWKRVVKTRMGSFQPLNKGDMVL